MVNQTIWLPLTLNQQLVSDSHGCTVVLRDTRWEITQEMETGWGMDEEVGELENGDFSWDETEEESGAIAGEPDRLDTENEAF